MKTTAIFSASLFAALASAAPVAQGTVNIKIALDSQELSAAVFSVPFGRLFKPSSQPGFTLSVNGASGVSIPTSSITCQAFRDGAGTTPLGTPFDETLPGTRISTTQTPAQVGSIFCSDAAGVQAQLKRSAPAPPPAATKLTARVQVNFESEGAIQTEVPLDNSIALVPNTKTAFSAFIVGVSPGVNAGKVECQAWKDVKATQKLGKPFSGSEEAVFSTSGVPVGIGSLKCKVV